MALLPLPHVQHDDFLLRDIVEAPQVSSFRVRVAVVVRMKRERRLTKIVSQESFWILQSPELRSTMHTFLDYRQTTIHKLHTTPQIPGRTGRCSGEAEHRACRCCQNAVHAIWRFIGEDIVRWERNEPNIVSSVLVRLAP